MKKLLLAFLFGVLGAWARGPQTVESCDGQFEARHNGPQSLTLQRGHQQVWKRTDLGEVDVLAVSRGGRVAIFKRFEVLVLAADGATLTSIVLDENLKAVWFSEDGAGLYLMATTRKTYFVLLGLSKVAKTSSVSQATLVRQLDNPESPKADLLVCVGKQIPWRRVERLQGISSPVRLALSAHHGNGRAAACLLQKKNLPAGDWLELCKLAGPTVLKPALLRVFEQNRGYTIVPGRYPWTEKVSRDQWEADPWVKGWLLEKGHSDKFYLNLLETLEDCDELLSPALERLAASPNQELALRSQYLLVKSRDPNKSHRLAGLARVGLFGGQPSYPVLDYFEQQFEPEVIPQAIKLLGHAREDVRRQAREVLFFQTRLDLGNQPEHWSAWLKLSDQERREKRFTQQGAGQTARILLRSQLGRLQPSDLKEHLRTVRIYPGWGDISGDGNYYFAGPSDGPAWSLWSLTSDFGQPITYPGEHTSYDSESGLMLSWVDDSVMISDALTAKPIYRWSFDAQKLGRPLNLANAGRVVQFDYGIVDTRSGKPLLADSGHRLKWISSGSTRAILWKGTDHQELWDYSIPKLLGKLPKGDWDGSQNFRSLLAQGKNSIHSHNARLQPDQPSYRFLESRLSPDGKQLLVSRADNSILMDLETGIWQRLPRTTLLLEFSPDSKIYAWCLDGHVELRRTKDGSLLARAPFKWRGDGPDINFSRSGKWFCACLDENSWLCDLSPSFTNLPPPEDQQLFAELWTGRRLQGGLTVALTPAEYDKRRHQWREICGTDWTLSPDHRPAPEGRVSWQAWLLAPLLALWWVVRRENC